MVSVATHTSSSKLRLDRTRAWLVQNKVAERLFVLAICLIYILHSIWAARTVLWFLVVPAVALTAVPYRRLLPVVGSAVFGTAAAFLLLIIATTMLGDGLPAKELFKQLRYVAAALVFVVVAAHLVRQDGDLLRLLFLWLAPVAALAAIRDVGSFSHWSLHTMLTTRLQGTQGLSVYYNSNVIGMMYAMPCVGAVAIMVTRQLRTWQFAMLYVSSLILLTAIAMTGSRGSLLTVMVGMLVSLLAQSNWRLAAAVVTMAVAGVALGLLMPAIGEWLESRNMLEGSIPLASEMLQRGDSLRFELWPVYLHMATLKPWLGYGLAFDTRVVLPSGSQVMNGHNIFICALVRGGVFAGLALAGVVLAALWSGWRAFRGSGEVTGLALLASCLAATAVDYEIVPSDLNYLYMLFWLPVAICLGTMLAGARPGLAGGAVPAADIAASQKRS